MDMELTGVQMASLLAFLSPLFGAVGLLFYWLGRYHEASAKPRIKSASVPPR